MPNPHTYTISQLAQEFDITTRTIRHYEDIGLLTPSRKGQTRIYSPGDRTKLKLILRGKRLGFSLEQSRNIIDMYDPASGNKEQLQSLLQGIGQQRQHLQHQLQEINLLMTDLDEAERICREQLNGNQS
ncbi:MerR family transcriptional regulator [Porticoccus sp. GXU_MW_L64]